MALNNIFKGLAQVYLVLLAIGPATSPTPTPYKIVKQNSLRRKIICFKVALRNFEFLFLREKLFVAKKYFISAHIQLTLMQFFILVPQVFHEK